MMGVKAVDTHSTLMLVMKHDQFGICGGCVMVDDLMPNKIISL